MTELQRKCLALIRCLGPIRVTEAMKHLNMPVWRVSFAFAALYKKGLVDGDLELFDVTEAGRAAFEQLRGETMFTQAQYIFFDDQGNQLAWFNVGFTSPGALDLNNLGDQTWEYLDLDGSHFQPPAHAPKAKAKQDILLDNGYGPDDPPPAGSRPKIGLPPVGGPARPTSGQITQMGSTTVFVPLTGASPWLSLPVDLGVGPFPSPALVYLIIPPIF